MPALRDTPLGTTTGALWRVAAYEDVPLRTASTLHAVRAINDVAATHSSAWLRDYQRYARNHTEYRCRHCGRWLRVVDATNADKIISAHTATQACAAQHTRRNLVWTGYIPGNISRERRPSERTIALEAERCTDGVWVSLVRQLREWRLNHDVVDEHAPPSWAALEDLDDQAELEALATTWTHHVCLVDTFWLGSRGLIREFFTGQWYEYLRETRPLVTREWDVNGGLSGEHYATLNELLQDAAIRGVVFVKPDTSRVRNPSVNYGYIAVASPREARLYLRISGFLSSIGIETESANEPRPDLSTTANAR